VGKLELRVPQDRLGSSRPSSPSAIRGLAALGIYAQFADYADDILDEVLRYPL
jgi:hypothetical protein